MYVQTIPLTNKQNHFEKIWYNFWIKQLNIFFLLLIYRSFMLNKINKTFLADLRYPIPPHKMINKQNIIIHESKESPRFRNPKHKPSKNKLPKKQPIHIFHHISELRNHCKRIKLILQEQNLNNKSFSNNNVNEAKTIKKTEISSNNIFTDKELENMDEEQNAPRCIKLSKRKLIQKVSDIKKEIQESEKWAEGVTLPVRRSKKQNLKKFQIRKENSYVNKLEFSVFDKLMRKTSLQDFSKVYNNKNRYNPINEIQDQLNEESFLLQNRLLKDRRFLGFNSETNLKRIEGIYQGRMLKLTEKLCEKKGYTTCPFSIKFIGSTQIQNETKLKKQRKEEIEKQSSRNLEVHEQRVREQRKRFIEKLKI